VAVGFAIALVAGCSSGSSGGGSTAGATTSPTASSASIDRATVDSALADVLTGLRTLVTASPGQPDKTAIVAAAQHAAADLSTAAGKLSPAPAGVPQQTITPVSTALLTIATLINRTASCLDALPTVTRRSAASCSQPLRHADKLTPQLAHDLISLSAYGSSPPDRFESDLLAALHGN
jgi:hypothetical protein